MTSTPPPVILLLQSGAYEHAHQAFSIAATAALSGRRVELYLSWWGLERLLKDNLDLPDWGPGREAVTDAFEVQRFPTLRQLLETARGTGLVRVTACSASVALFGKTARELEGKVDGIAGWSAILERTSGVVERFSW